MSDAMPRLGEAIARARSALAASSPNPHLDAELLLGHVLGRGRAWLVAHARDSIAPADHASYEALVRRRADGEPVAYLTGQREFWSLDLRVGPGALIPRHETELLVERALVHLSVEVPSTVGDLGTGCGAVALAIACERPRAHVVASDRSLAALAIAKDNVRRLARGRVSLLAACWTEALSDLRFDMIVSNPPYVGRADPHLALGDLRYEPTAALASGDDGLADLRALSASAPRCLRPGGWLLAEHGAEQGPQVRALFAAAGLTAIETLRDLAGLERVTEGRRA